MDKLLRSEEMDKIESLFQKSFDLSQNTIYFPVRHHSPACSYHLKSTIERYNPDCILIEGPKDANHLIKELVREDAKLPLSLYMSFADKKGEIGEEGKRHMCYYPFLSYSPEFVAVNEAEKREINCEFIDLSYEEILKAGVGLRKRSEKETYSDEYMIERSKFIKTLVKKEKLRNFDELWEKRYEINGLKISTEEFVKNMLAYCVLSRLSYTQEELEKEGHIAREACMKYMIEEANKKYERVLVVTGGFHTFGLLKEAKAKKAKKTSKSEAYAMPYSFEECDQLNGYSSGMPFVAFYQKIWDRLEANSQNAFEETISEFVTKLGRKIRKEEYGVSVTDSIEAINMARGLAVLRDKKNAGAWDMIDGVRSTFIKSELNEFTNKPLSELRKLMTGNKVGALGEGADYPPLVKDFRDRCKKLRIDIASTKVKEKALDIYKKDSHRDASKLFHMVEFLESGFCKKTKGPDFAQKSNTNLVREVWQYRWRPEVEARLIEKSAYGGTLEEASKEILLKNLKDITTHTGEASKLMLSSFVMGLYNMSDEIMYTIEDMAAKDGDFMSLTEALSNIWFVKKHSWALSLLNSDKIEKCFAQIYNRACGLVGSLGSVSEDVETKTVEALKQLYDITVDSEINLSDDVFKTQLQAMVKQAKNPAMEGAGIGMIRTLKLISDEEVINITNSYLKATGEMLSNCSRFMKGLFMTAREVVFLSDIMLNGIDDMLKRISHEEFLNIIPELRLAFSYFVPYEIDEIAGKVAKGYNLNSYELTEVSGIDETLIKEAKEMDKRALNKLSKWGVFDV